VFTLVALAAFRTTVADWHDVPTGSMEPSIEPGDRIVVNNLAYQLQAPFLGWHLVEWSDPQRGDVVVCYSPANGQRLVKRVIGVPGDTVEMRRNVLLINGRAANYHWDNLLSGTESLPAGKPHPVQLIPAMPSRRSFAPLTVPAGEFYVMGDNRDNSLDSRYFGFVDRGQIVGRAIGIAFSLDPDHHRTPRWDRTLRGLP